MRLEIGRRFLYQWESDQKLLPDVDCKMVHFANGTTEEALSVDVIDGKADVPNIFLQDTANIRCYAWNGNSVVAYAEFPVRAKEKPAAYVYKETAVRQYDKLLEELEKKGAYYVPVVDGDGNLRWEKSLEQMPDVPGSNVKGPKGDKGDKGPKGDKGDPGEVNIDDAAVGGAAWSSKQIVDTLCPGFTAEGAVVVCEPLEGYPLSVYTELPTDHGVSKITLYHKGLDEAGDEVSTEYTVDFGEAYFDGYYDWETGELQTEEEGTMQFAPQVITAFFGRNSFRSDCGKTTVMGMTHTFDDSKVGEAGWSSKNIVDKLCPSFTESGGVVCCEPVEGYPLEVEWQPKNLIPKTEPKTETINGTTFDLNDDGSVSINGTPTDSAMFYLTRALDAKPLRGKQITVNHNVGESVYLAVNLLYNDGTSKSYNWLRGNRTDLLTKVVPNNAREMEVFVVVLTGFNGEAVTFYPQLEIGTTPTAYEPHAETAIITSCGKNLFDFKKGVYEVNWIGVDSIERNYFGYAIHLPAGTYTLHAEKGIQTSNDYIYGVVIKATGVDKSLALVQGATTNNTYTVALEQGDIIYIYDGYKRTMATANDLFTRNMVQIEAGTVATAYEPYIGASFGVGEKIPALAGINSLYANAGNITVTGKADPVAINKKLEARLAALEAAAVNNA